MTAIEEKAVAEAAHRLFGYSALRPGQYEAIRSVVGGHDTLAVLATGSGKSAIYEIAGPLLSGSTVVISPLLALQRDQVAALAAGGRLTAVTINSTLTTRRRQQVLDELSAERGRPDFVFLAPEQLAQRDVLEGLAKLRPVLLAVDEAHLVSEWGPDFRPEYLRIGVAATALGRPVLLALTATATPEVRQDIIQRLGLHQPQVLVRGFGRPNIRLAVHSYFIDDQHKLEVVCGDVVEAVRQRGHGIVYAATHNRVEILATRLSSTGLRVASYHAGLGSKKRTEAEQRFHAGELDVVVATIAFGMGIDKPDIRWVFHADVPSSLDEYYQELGRAGRDGDPADAELYFRTEDMALPRMYAAGSGPSENNLKAIADAIEAAGTPLTLSDVQERSGLSKNGAEGGVMALADAGGVTVEPDGQLIITRELTEAVKRAIGLVHLRRGVERSRVETMQAYVEEQGCRWNFLLQYLGETTSTSCGHCDNDERADANSDSRHPERPFAPGARVRHHVYGDGEVIGYAGTHILVDFEHQGYRRLDLAAVTQDDLLEDVNERQ
jgi:ATP-dependent DNA helicase RecQ